MDDFGDIFAFLFFALIGAVIVGSLVVMSAPVLVPSLAVLGIAFYNKRKSGLAKIHDNLKEHGINLAHLTPEERDMHRIRYADGGWFEMFCATLPIKAKLKVRGKNYRSIGAFATDKGTAHEALTKERSQTLHLHHADALAQLNLDTTVSDQIAQSAFNKRRIEELGWSPPMHAKEKYHNLEAEEILAIGHELKQEHREDLIHQFRTGTEQQRMEILSTLMKTGQTNLAQLLTETAHRRDE